MPPYRVASRGATGSGGMATTANPPQYRTLDVKDEDDRVVNLWTCEECGSVVGPMVRRRTAHSDWHARVADLS